MPVFFNACIFLFNQQKRMLPRDGTLYLHRDLVPRYRGAARDRIAFGDNERHRFTFDLDITAAFLAPLIRPRADIRRGSFAPAITKTPRPRDVFLVSFPASVTRYDLDLPSPPPLLLVRLCRIVNISSHARSASAIAINGNTIIARE